MARKWRRADINACDKDGRTVVQRASDSGHEAVVRLLVENGPGEYGRTALQKASDGGHEEVVRLVLNDGADFHAVGTDGSLDDGSDYDGQVTIHSRYENPPG